MRIGILTYHKSRSCGALLQACALKVFLRARGHAVFFPDCNSVGDERPHFPYRRLSMANFWDGLKSLVWYVGVEMFALGFEDVRWLRFRRFIKNHLADGKQGQRADLSKYDCLVFGSDQIWNPDISGADTTLFLGESVEAGVRKIAYAASAGDKELTGEYKIRLKKAVSKFDALSVREWVKGVDLLDIHGRLPVHVIDPTFLVQKEVFAEFECKRRLKSDRFLFLYVVNYCPRAFDIAERLSLRLGLGLVAVDSCQRGLWRSKLYEDKAASPDRFLAYIRDAECVVTNSYHGVAFSLIYNKQFVALPSAVSAQKSIRTGALLERFALTERLVDLDAPEDDLVAMMDKRLPTDLEERIRDVAKSSVLWLDRVLLDASAPIK